MDADGERGDSNLQLLRTSWQFAATLQFCRALAHELRFKPFSAESLENALLHPYSHQYFLSELCFNLLRHDVTAPFTEKESEIWENMLHKKMRTHWRDAFDRNPLESCSLFEVSPLARLHILYYLCEWRAHECQITREYMKLEVEGADHSYGVLQQAPIGEDAKGNRYWYFSYNNEDCRLYCEYPPKPKKGKKGKVMDLTEPEWDTVCLTLEDLEDFVDKLSASRNRSERQLHSVLSEDVLPALIETANARRKAEEKAALLEAMPRKRSSRIQEVQKKKEEEDKKRFEEEEERRRIDQERERERKEKERELRLLARHDTGGFFGVPASREERLAMREQKRVLNELGQEISEPQEELNGSLSEQESEEAVENHSERGTTGWSPLGPPVLKRRRSTATRPTTNFAVLVAAVQQYPDDLTPRAEQRELREPREQRTPREPRARQVAEENIYAKPRHSFRNRSSHKTKDLNSDFGDARASGGDPIGSDSVRDQPSTAHASHSYTHRHPMQRMKELSKEHYLSGSHDQRRSDDQVTAPQSLHHHRLKQVMAQQQRHNPFTSVPNDNQLYPQQPQHKSVQQQQLSMLFNKLTPQQKVILSQLPDKQKKVAYLIQCTQSQQAQQHHQHAQPSAATVQQPQTALPQQVLQQVSTAPEASTMQAHAMSMNQHILSRLSAEQRQELAAMPAQQQAQYLQFKAHQLQQQQQYRAAQMQQQAELMHLQGQQAHQSLVSQQHPMKQGHLGQVQPGQLGLNYQYHAKRAVQGPGTGAGMPSQLQNNKLAFAHGIGALQQNSGAVSASISQANMHSMSRLATGSPMVQMATVDAVPNGMYSFAQGSSDGQMVPQSVTNTSPNIPQRSANAGHGNAYSQAASAPLFGVANPMRNLHSTHGLPAASSQMIVGSIGASSAMLTDWLNSGTTNGMASPTMHTQQ